MVAFWFTLLMLSCSLFLILMGCYSVYGMIQDFRRGREFVKGLEKALK